MQWQPPLYEVIYWRPQDARLSAPWEQTIPTHERLTSINIFFGKKLRAVIVSMPRIAYSRPAPARRQAAPRRTTTVRRAPVKRAPARAPAKRPTRSSGSMFAKAGSGLGGALGSAFGPVGTAAGTVLGGIGGSMLSKILGHGDYAVSNAPVVKENTLLTNAANIPQFGTGKVAANFRHREFLGDVYSSSTAGAFKIDSYPINPGLDTTFPWLSGVVGAKFQQYRINGMTFEFRSMSSDALNSTNTALGSVIMSTDYDSADTVFQSKQEMENTEYGVSCKPSINMMHGIECARFQTPVSELYIRAFDVPAGKDIRLYDLGRFSIASVGCQGTNVNLGELWVTYDIDAFKAIEQAPNYLSPVSQWQLNGVTDELSLGASQTELIDQIGVTFEYKEGISSFILPSDMSPGTKISMYYGVYGASTAGVSIMSAVPLNGLTLYGSSMNTPYPGPTATVDFRGQYVVFIYDGTGTPANPPKVQIPGGALPTGITNSRLNLAFLGAAYQADGL